MAETLGHIIHKMYLRQRGYALRGEFLKIKTCPTKLMPRTKTATRDTQGRVELLSKANPCRLNTNGDLSSLTLIPGTGWILVMYYFQLSDQTELTEVIVHRIDKIIFVVVAILYYCSLTMSFFVTTTTSIAICG